MSICIICKGSRYVTFFKRCPVCNGTGKVNGHHCTNYGCKVGMITNTERCGPCGGTGYR